MRGGGGAIKGNGDFDGISRHLNLEGLPCCFQTRICDFFFPK